MIHYTEIIKKLYEKQPNKLPERMLCLDPGNTTGVALFMNGVLLGVDQLPTITGESINWKEVVELFAAYKPTLVVCEDYRVYAHKLERHTYSAVPTLRLIGGIDFYCYHAGIPIRYQMAVEHKSFVTDEKLKAWGLWQKGMQHSRDAIRIGIFALIKGGKIK